MKKIRVFATSANLGPGFDSMGICLDICNEYGYELADKYELVGFDERFIEPSNNLIITAYEAVFASLRKDLVFVRIEQLKQDIPTCRGLGSSAACIVAGAMIANDVLGEPLSKYEILEIAAFLENHPDNAAAAIFGGLEVANIDYGSVIHESLAVSPNLHFTVCIPDFELPTEEARKVVPKNVRMLETVFNLSHAVMAVKGFETGDMEIINKALIDKLHEPFRLRLIPGAFDIRKYVKEEGGSLVISGAGSTLLVISGDEIETRLRNKFDNNKWYFKEVKVSVKGAYWYE